MFFRYPGGKSKLKKPIIKVLVQIAQKSGLKEYREPFFGGGSIGLDLIDKISFDKLWINDKDCSIWCIWQSVCEYPKDFQDAIQNTVIDINNAFDYFEELKIKVKANSNIKPNSKEQIIEQALSKLLIHQTSYSGLGTMAGGPIGGRNQKSKWKINCRWNPKNISKKIQAIHLKLKNKTQCSCFDFLKVIQTGRALVYLDPPYYNKGKELYQCFFSNKDHEDLMNFLKKSDHEWVLSYDDCPEVRELYSWAWIQEFQAKYTINAETKVMDINGNVVLNLDGTKKKQANIKSELLIFPPQYNGQTLI
jgi:DNA adenine methylase